MNMNYCAVENTAKAMRQVIRLMSKFDTVEEWVDSLNEYERDSLESLIECCREFASRASDIEEAVDTVAA